MTASGSSRSTGIALLGRGDLRQRRLRAASGEACGRPADRRAERGRIGAARDRPVVTSPRARPSPMPEAPTERR